MIFTIDGTPVPKLRHRSAIVKGKIRCYDSQETTKTMVSWKLKAQLKSALESKDKTILESARSIVDAHAFDVEFEFHMTPPISKSTSERHRLLWTGFATEKPDIDNLVKFYLDAANKVIWSDDKKIVEVKAKKIYSEVSKTIITITGKSNMASNDKIDGILGVFPPNRYYEMLHELKLLAAIESTPNRSFQKKAEDAAYVISRFADGYSEELMKIKKKFPGYWQFESYGVNATDKNPEKHS